MNRAGVVVLCSLILMQLAHTYLLSTPRWSAAKSAALRLGVRAPQGMRSMGLEGVLSPLVEEPPPSSEGLSLLALLGGFLDALMLAACTRVIYHSRHMRLSDHFLCLRI